MSLKFLFFILGLWGSTFFSQENGQNGKKSKPEIFIVGTIHSMHFNPDYNYSVIDLLAQISALKPDFVCGEIVPEAFGQITEGYFPPEAAYLAEMAPVLNYRFVPVDWRLDYATQSKADSLYPKSVMEQVSSFGSTYFARMKESYSQSIYDGIHSELNIAIVDSVFEKIIGANPITEIAHGNWHERNRRIVENGLIAAKNARRIVFVIGSDHIPQIRRQLKDRGFEPVIPKRLFVPCNNFKVTEAVIERWKLNLENLYLIRDKKIPTSDDYYQKIINSRRIQELELAIRKSS
ncbi:MAG: hypothetical protein WC833_13810 [Bacteroidales bacterium]|jgi:hypothetical protein